MATYQSELIKTGDLNAFGEFFRNNYSRLLKYCQLFIKNTNIAEDLVQETFVSLWEKRKNIDTERSIESLLFVSLRNRCLNYLRDENYLKYRTEEFNSDKIEQLQYLAHWDYLWEEDLSMEERLVQEINKAIEKLPQKCRQIFILAKIDGLKNREVAIKLGISTKAVEKQLAIARKKISEQLDENYPLGFVLFFLWFC